MKLITFNSTNELLERSADWNDLWQRSDCTWPTMRAEPLTQWLDAFAPRSRICIIAVEDEGRLAAALPLVERRVGPLRIGKLPGGDLCSVGDLLLDPDRGEASLALDLLVSGIQQSRWPLILFDAMFPATPRWRSLLAAFEHRGLPYVARHRGMTGVIDVGGTWENYFATRSRNHRRQMRVAHNRATAEGTVSLRYVVNPQANQIESLLHQGFEIEDRGWKGASGSSTLRTPGAFAFFVEQARLLSASGHLLLTFLDVNAVSIAFEYGWLSKGVYHSLKVGYDEARHQLSPGQLLRYLMMEQAFHSGELSAVDYLGPLSDATAKWATRTYPVSRLVVANGMIGRAALKLYERLRPAKMANKVLDADSNDSHDAIAEKIGQESRV